MSEFRKEPVSGEWIIMAPERAKRPHEWPKKPLRVVAPKDKCPFEDLRISGNWPPIAILPSEQDWRIAVIPNKYPALEHRHICAETFQRGPYPVAQGVGHHELVVTRDHDRNLAKMAPDEAAEVLGTIQSRYRALAADACVQYVLAFYNWGPTAGASLYHPHYQILGLPVIPPDVAHSLHGSKKFHARENKCAHCAILAFERRAKKRIIAENRQAVALAPFASVNRFEVRIFPKRHENLFENSTAAEIRGAADLLRDMLGRIAKYWHDPDLNFYIHSAPAKNQKRSTFYHWHIEIVPKDIIAPTGGFELGTRIDINPIDPDKVAAMLRGEKTE
jgi:UDPglucose--hexose-1-phosphate uridylyltransferase